MLLTSINGHHPVCEGDVGQYKKKIRETKTVKRLRVNKTLNLQDEELVTTSFFESI